MQLDTTFEKLYGKILKFISLQPRSKKEIIVRLKKYLLKSKISNGEKEQLTIKMLRRLGEENLIDDKKYASDFVFTISSSTKARGQNYIKQFLTKKGIDSATIDNVVKGIDPDNQLAMAKTAALKKLPLINKGTAMQRKQKLWEFLLRRGFAPNTIRSVVEEVFGVE